jgi:hypothetical protein
MYLFLMFDNLSEEFQTEGYRFCNEAYFHVDFVHRWSQHVHVCFITNFLEVPAVSILKEKEIVTVPKILTVRGTNAQK